MGINYAELQKKMESAGDNGVSKLNMRNEEKQHKFQPKRLNHLKKEKRKKSKLCFVKEIAIPFNPVTGKEDETYNAGSKWRPPYSVESVIKLAKSYAMKNEESKAAMMRYAGVKEWNPTDANVVTDEDYALFKNYLTTRIFSIPAVKVTIPSMCGNSFGRDYTVNVKIDPITGQYIGKVPLILQAHKFFIELAYEELQDYNDKIKSGKIKHDDTQQKEYRSSIFDKVPVGDLAPINFIQAFEIPLDKQFGLAESDCFTSCDKNWIDKHTVLIRVNKAISDTLDKFMGGDYAAIDNYPEYFVVDMSCPADAETPTELGKRTSYEKEMLAINTMPGYENFREATVDYLDNFDDLEETVFRSSFVSNYDERVDAQLLEACNSLIDLKNPFLTQKVIESNKDFLVLALGDKMDSILAEMDCGISDLKDGQLDSEAAKKAAKTYDIEGQLKELGGLDEVNTDEIIIDED